MANTIHIEVTETIDAPAAQVYAVLADYHTSHPAILADAFKDLIVEQGGHGEGTVYTTHMQVMGTTRAFHMTVTEPHPGRVLREEDPNTGTITFFTVEPLADGQRSRLTISTDSRLSPGIAGLMERLMTPSLLGRIYKQEMAKINDYMQKHRPSTAS